MIKSVIPIARDQKPEPQVDEEILITVNWEWVKALIPDEDKDITIEGELN
jgi:hypothetical protein